MARALTSQRRGGPIAVLGLVLAAWVAGRMAVWESPIPLGEFGLPVSEFLIAEDNRQHAPDPVDGIEGGEQRFVFSDLQTTTAKLRARGRLSPVQLERQSDRSFGSRPMMAAGHQFLMAAAFRVDWIKDGGTQTSLASPAKAPRRAGFSPVAPPRTEPAADLDRWSLDTFAFYRQGSNAAPISQGRVPVYGASQVGANLQYRFAPQSPHDPRVFVRGYRAFVRNGENEGAIGVSARPIGDLPVRVAAEMRVTDNIFGTELRPAGYAYTELPPQNLPFNFRLEAYGSAGYVGGQAKTAFVDGQAAITREIVSLDGPGDQPMRLSIGGAAWGGAQRDANRLDVGPTMRLDLSVGEVPARITVDYREQVSGDASPVSGVAATLSTQF